MSDAKEELSRYLPERERNTGQRFIGVATDGLEKAIIAALVRTAVREGKHITVTSDQLGVVRLTGVVRSWAEREDVERTAWSAPGVTGVQNHLIVTPWASTAPTPS